MVLPCVIQRWWPRTLVIGSAVGAVVAFVLSDRQASSAVFIAVAFGAAAVAGLLVPSRPIVAFGILFLLATPTLFIVDLSVGRLRLEQPAIVAVIAALLVSRLLGRPTPLRPILPIAAAGAVYLGTLGLSSILLAPDQGVSLRLVAWTGLSMAGGVAAYLLTSANAEKAVNWIIAGGVATAVAGILAAVVFYLAGPFTPSIGVASAASTLPRVVVWSWEVNLYASYVAAIVPLAFEAFRRRRGPLTGAVLLLLLIGVALGITRGAWLGLAAGLAVSGTVLLLRRIPRASVARAVTVTVAGVAIGLVMAAWLLNPTVQLEHLVAQQPPTVPGATAAPAPTLRIAAGGTQQTVDFRLDHITPALDDWKTSPIIGLGAESYGQRHAEVSGSPAYLNIMALAVLYDSGIVGLVALLVMGLLVARALWRASGDRGRTGLAAAYLGSLAVLLVAYQATNALHFALNWLLLGAALGVAVGARRAVEGTVTERIPPIA